MDAEIIRTPDVSLLVLDVTQDTLVDIRVCELVRVHSLEMNFYQVRGLTMVNHILKKVDVSVIFQTIYRTWVCRFEF